MTDRKAYTEEVELIYYCPVYVTVDIEGGEVTDVQIGDDKSIRLDSDTAMSDPMVKAAYNIAESTDWPAWRFV